LPSPKRAETTAFSLDIAGRYVCNGLDEAIASTTGRPDARRFDLVIVGGLQTHTGRLRFRKIQWKAL
jgi:hypothetical protein